MWPLNNDMDELYRKAADDYPLKTNSSDWEKFSQRLPEKESKGNSLKRKIATNLLLSGSLILIPLVIAVTHKTHITELQTVAPTQLISVKGQPHLTKNKVYKANDEKLAYTASQLIHNASKTNFSLTAGN